MKSAVIVIVGLCYILVAESASDGENHKVNYASVSSTFYNEKNTSNEEALARSEIQGSEPGPIGYIYQLTSGKTIHPYRGSANPRDNTPLVLHRGSGENRLQFRYIPQPRYGHFGYIQHVSSRQYVHPRGGSAYPRDNTRLVFHRDRHYGNLFTFDEENEQIIHIGGKYWHPYGGSIFPRDNTRVVLYRGKHAATRFYLGDAYGNKISAYPKPDLRGTWELVKAYINPRATHTYTEKYTVGRSLTKSMTTRHAWSVSAGFAKGMFSASTEYSGFVEKTRESTWTNSHEVTSQVHVEAGETIVIWQFVYSMNQYNEELTFRSNIIGDTNSIHVKPTLSKARSI